MLIIGTLLVAASIVMEVGYLIYNKRHNRKIKVWDIVISQVFLALWVFGLELMLDYRSRNYVHEIRCDSPAEVTYGINIVTDGYDNSSSDTIFVYTFDREIKHKHYPKNNRK